MEQVTRLSVSQNDSSQVKPLPATRRTGESFGQSTFQNGDVYEGEYRNGVRHGRGVYRFASGAVYDGEYVNGKKHGQGTFIYSDGSKYSGEWKEDKRDGYGEYKYVNGDEYCGQWVKHIRHGRGVYRYDSVDLQIDGSWKEGRRIEDGQALISTNTSSGGDKVQQKTSAATAVGSCDSAAAVACSTIGGATQLSTTESTTMTSQLATGCLETPTAAEGQQQEQPGDCDNKTEAICNDTETTIQRPESLVSELQTTASCDDTKETNVVVGGVSATDDAAPAAVCGDETAAAELSASLVNSRTEQCTGGDEEQKVVVCLTEDNCHQEPCLEGGEETSDETRAPHHSRQEVVVVAETDTRGVSPAGADNGEETEQVERDAEIVDGQSSRLGDVKLSSTHLEDDSSTRSVGDCSGSVTGATPGDEEETRRCENDAAAADRDEPVIAVHRTDSLPEIVHDQELEQDDGLEDDVSLTGEGHENTADMTQENDVTTSGATADDDKHMQRLLADVLRGSDETRCEDAENCSENIHTESQENIQE
jgi:hypothetical protein